MQKNREDRQALYKRQQRAARRLVRASQFLFIGIASFTTLYWLFIPALKKGIKEWVYYQSQGVYSLDIDELFIDWRDGSLLLKNISFQTDKQRLQQARETNHTLPVIQSHLALLRIEDIDWWKYWRNDSLFIRKISIQGGNIYWQQQGSRSSTERKLNYYRISRALFESINAVTPSLHLKEVSIDDLSLQLKILYASDTHTHRLGKLASRIFDIVVERSALYSTQRPFFAHYATFQLRDYQGNFSENSLCIKALHFDTRTPNVDVWSPSFGWKQGNFQAKELHIKGIHWTALFFERRLHLHAVLLQAPQLHLTRLPAGKHSFLSQKAEWQRQLPALSKQWFDEVRIDSLWLSGGSIHLPESQFKGIDMQLYGFSPTHHKHFLFCQDIELSIQKTSFEKGTIQASDIRLHTRRRLLSINQLVRNAPRQKVKIDGLHLSPDFQHYWNSDELSVDFAKIEQSNIELQSSQEKKDFLWKQWVRRLRVRHGIVEKGNLQLHLPTRKVELNLQDYHLRLRQLQLPGTDSLAVWQRLGECIEDFRAERLSYQSDGLQWGMADLRLLSDSMGIGARKLYFASPMVAGYLPMLYVPSWQWTSLWRERRLQADTLRLSGLELYLSPTAAVSPSDSSALSWAAAQMLARWLHQNQWKLSIHHVDVSVPTLYWLPSSSLSVEGEIQSLSLRADGLYIEDSVDVWSNSFLAKQFRLKSKACRLRLQGNLSVQFDSLNLDKQRAQMHLYQLRWKNGTEQSLRIAQGRLHGIDWDTLWQKGRLHAHSLAFIRPQLRFTSKQQGTSTASLILPARLHLDSLLISDADIWWQQDEQQTQYRVQHANLLAGPLDGQYPLLDSLAFLRCTARAFFRLSPHDTLSFAHMQWDAKGNGLRLRDVQWRALHARAYVPYLYVRKIDLPKLVRGDSLILGRMQAGNVFVSIEKDRWAEPLMPQYKAQIFPLAYLSIDSLQVDNSHLLFHVAKADGITKHQLQGIDLYIERFVHRNGQIEADSDFLLSIKQYYLEFPEPLYHLHLHDIKLQRRLPAVEVGSVELFSSVNTDELWKQRLYAKPILQARLQELRLSHVPWDALLRGKELYIPRLQVASWQLNAIDDLRLAKNPLRRPPMPHELLQKTAGMWLIDTVVFEGGQIIYEQKQWNNTGSGKLFFDEVHLQLYHLGNLRDSLPLRIEMVSLFMKQGILALNIDIDRHTPVLHATYAGTLGRMSAVYLNRMLEPTTQVSLQTGTIKKITFKGTMHDHAHRGSMLAIYRNFKVSVLDAQAKRKRRIVSKLVNMLIRNTNRHKTGAIHYNRLPTDGFLRILWQGLASGLRDTLLPEIVKERE
jgi:hypothetical protein